MHYKILVFGVLLLSTVCRGQNLSLAGKVVYFNLEKNGKLYYTEPGKNFSSKKFITYNENKEYSFKISIKKIREEKIKAILFTIDLNNKPDDKHACVHRVNVAEIVNATQFVKAKSIALKSDLDLMRNCSVSSYFDAAENKKERFVGKYEMVVNDTIHYVHLSNEFYDYHSNLSKQNDDFMNEEYGSWEYNEKDAILSFKIWEQLNVKWGLLGNKRYNYQFKVVEEAGQFKFTGVGNNATLTKL